MKGSTFAIIISILAIVAVAAFGYAFKDALAFSQIGLTEQQKAEVNEIVMQKYDSIQNPTFYNIEEVYDFIDRFEVADSRMESFKKIPLDVAVNAAQVCLEKGHPIQLSDIVESYESHQAVYDKLITEGNILDYEEAPRPDSSKTAVESINQSNNPDSMTTK